MPNQTPNQMPKICQTNAKPNAKNMPNKCHLFAGFAVGDAGHVVVVTPFFGVIQEGVLAFGIARLALDELSEAAQFFGGDESASFRPATNEAIFKQKMPGTRAQSIQKKMPKTSRLHGVVYPHAQASLHCTPGGVPRLLF